MQDNNTNGRTPYSHIAYATSADGTQGFSTTSAKGKTYFGYYTDYSAEDSNIASSYTWTPIEGEEDADTKGIKGPAGKQGNEKEAPKKRSIPTEPQPNIGKKLIPKWVQWAIVIMVTGSIGLNFAGLATGVVLWFVFDWINGDL